MKIPFDVQQALQEGKRALLAEYGDDPNVTGAGMGVRQRGGEWTEEFVVIAMVAKKRPAAHVSRRRMLPAAVTVGGKRWGVDVIQAGPFRVNNVRADGPPETRAKVKTALSDDPGVRERMRPLMQGCSISNPLDGATAGTLGCFVIDPVDDTVCLLTNNHVVARVNQGRPGEPIIQPGRYDGGHERDDRVATLKRLAPLVDGTNVDAAIAKLDDQDNYSLEFAQNAMAPISRTHPTVGMVCAGDSAGSSFMARMDVTLAAMNVRLPIGGNPGSGGGALVGVIGPDLFMNIEKVGRTTGYTSATILGFGFDIQVDTGTEAGIVQYENLIWSLFFSWFGDSGSVVCAGGNGNLVVVMLLFLLPCVFLAAVEKYYAVAVTEDNKLADQIRDEFLAHSLVGRLLISTTYVNSQTVIDRLEAREGNENQETERAWAQTYHAKYRDFVASVLANPNSGAVVTQEHLDDVRFALDGETMLGALSQEEYDAAVALYDQILLPTLGMNRQQVLDYMNSTSVYLSVYNVMSGVSSIEVIGPVNPQGR
ncbi:hypothetical protein EV193_10240 [Herbihabitans rhizosphaerae]|uniref:Uncharacterized protein n=1 Tax=Herbihabitans rhizosphaerae TaxID=1872711 RepID=A0A4Q7L1S6_9PSEU|nr:hypothetical protein [Herbihabitans rhizosphaerae]RZS43064.1 hypothetical protein EV193_10240 [Herbihabitans rhizosphaerae]